MDITLPFSKFLLKHLVCFHMESRAAIGVTFLAMINYPFYTVIIIIYADNSQLNTVTILMAFYDHSLNVGLISVVISNKHPCCLF